MEPYSKHQPTEFDRKGAFLPDRQDWLVLNVAQNRDSEALEQSNFACALAQLGGESDDVEVHRFGHWANGWYEIILINPTAEKLVAIGEDIERGLENYPVLNEEDFSRRETEEFQRMWHSYLCREFRQAITDAAVEYITEKIDDLDEDVLYNAYNDHANCSSPNDYTKPERVVDTVLEKFSINTWVRDLIHKTEKARTDATPSES